MNLTNLISGTTGLVHFAAAIVAMISGMYILLAQKGTKQHKKIGYFYVASMLVLNITAFMIYRLYGKFGIFHGFAIWSLLTLAAGMYPILRRTSKNYILQHFRFMYWSVIGLYCAFAAETLVRLPKIMFTSDGKPMLIFYKLVGVATLAVMLIGVLFFIKNRAKWAKEFGTK
jgi:uncharacterized membrane protein